MTLLAWIFISSQTESEMNRMTTKSTLWWSVLCSILVELVSSQDSKLVSNDLCRYQLDTIQNQLHMLIPLQPAHSLIVAEIQAKCLLDALPVNYWCFNLKGAILKKTNRETSHLNNWVTVWVIGHIRTITRDDNIKTIMMNTKNWNLMWGSSQISGQFDVRQVHNCYRIRFHYTSFHLLLFF